MKCAHCAFSCGPKKKNFMELRVFEAALKLAGSYGETVVIGGGEPTLHPEFWLFLGLALGESNVENVWMATNGSQTKTAIALAGLAAGSDRLGVALSRDAYHERIDEAVSEAFARNQLEFRDVTYKVVRAGRAKRTQVWQREGCPCEEIFVDPGGYIYSCGCKRLKIGNVVFGLYPTGEALYSSGHEHGVNPGECLFDDGKERKEALKWLKSLQ